MIFERCDICKAEFKLDNYSHSNLQAIHGNDKGVKMEICHHCMAWIFENVDLIKKEVAKE